MSIHKLTAGSGYDYLTRQVAALDATHKGHIGLASYYTARGETPGAWTGAGLPGIDGLTDGDPVTAEQMKALFGLGLHPLAAERQANLAGPDLTDADYQAVTRLGAPFKVFDHDINPFQVEVAKRVAAVNDGLPGDWPVPANVRARIRTEVATEYFRAEHGRDPDGPRELAGIIAKHSRPRTDAVAGYDLTFSPVKSVSTLWAVADPPTAAAIERAHQAAVADALRFLEQQALFTRTGANGVRQVDVQGLVAAAFTHRDSRAGDPDLHTHVAVANKVQTLDGRWLSIDGRVLFKATVTASETYNTALETHLRDTLGLRFAERPDPDSRKRPVREIVGVDPQLNQCWSTRRAHIDIRRGELVTEFQRRHGRPPTPVEALQLAQQATLETRDPKHEPRSLAEQRAAWHAQAVEVLGGSDQVRDMVHQVLRHRPITGPKVNQRWMAQVAERVLGAVEENRATWQVWHIRAEAQRQIRAAEVSGDRAEQLVDRIVDEVLHRRSISLARPTDGVTEPGLLRRADGASVYTVAGADLYTSTRILAAEQRLLHVASRHDGRTVDQAAVDVALLEMVANGTALNAGQVGLVRSMATSGVRLQLAIAPAGAGKTTALHALAAAWTIGGGEVIGLAPSAAAAGQLRDQIRSHTDTLAKLTWSIHNDDLPDWVSRIGPSTLVVIDEAGMAGTLTLDTAVQFVVGRGGSVRLVGDDQQLAAIGAGGILRDIQSQHGAVRLTEVLRFTDRAEAGATLALRDGRPEALGFYLDQHRIHVGDLTTLTEHLFDGWQADRQIGLDALMLAPTRELAAELNHRARTHRLTQTARTDTARIDTDSTPRAGTVELADGSQASVGDLVISRSNDRRLRLTGTDWVKNGDRWRITRVHRDGALTVQHTQNRRTVRLPAGYVQASVELGYATTVHGAQGVTADTMHGLATGAESRQQLYTMLTRGRAANHLYLQVVGDGDPHSIIHPDTIRPRTPVDLLEQILARDDTPRSATTTQTEQRDPATRLGEATARYVDALYAAAEDLAGPAVLNRLEADADQLIPGLSGEAAWPALRAHLLLLAASGADAIDHLQLAARVRELDSADDRAAVLDWRLDDTGLRNAGPGPLPWIPAVPPQLANDQSWGPYLKTRSQLVSESAEQVRSLAQNAETPIWASSRRATTELIADIEAWRAAMQVSPDDQRPTGPLQLQKAAHSWQQHLDTSLAGPNTPAVQEWAPPIAQAGRAARLDTFLPVLTERLAALSRSGINAAQLLNTAINTGPLPDEHGAAALWWRISRHLQPAITADADQDLSPTTAWADQLVELVGADLADRLHHSPLWPALVSTVDHALQRGWPLEHLLTVTTTPPADDDCQALLWRISILTDPAPLDEDQAHVPPDDPHTDIDPQDRHSHLGEPTVATNMPVRISAAADTAHARHGRPEAIDQDRWVEPDLAVAAMVRDTGLRLEQTDVDVKRMFARADAWRDCPVPRERLLAINEMTLAFFQAQFPHSWGRDHLRARMGQDLTGDPRFRPGQSPPGWTRLVDHLHRHRVTDEEMVAARVATTTRKGRLIDCFRDRLIFPITNHEAEVLGFVGRRHPDAAETALAGPKYLNTAETPLYHKSAQLFGAQNLTAGQIPVIVEGPIDAIAVALAGGGRYVGVAPLGTTLTDEQATQLAHHGANPIVGTDADLPGQVAAERAFWHLTAHGLNPRHAKWPDGTDPADVLTHHGPHPLIAALDRAQPLGAVLIEERLRHLPAGQARTEAIQIIAAQPPNTWDAASDRIATRLEGAVEQIRRNLLTAVQAWNTDPQAAAQQQLTKINNVKARLSDTQAVPRQRWNALAAELDPRLLHQADWPATAALLQAGHDHGHDMDAATRAIVNEAPLGRLPAQDLRYRLLNHLNIPIEEPPPAATKTATAIRHEKPEAQQPSPTTARTPAPQR